MTGHVRSRCIDILSEHVRDPGGFPDVELAEDALDAVLDYLVESQPYLGNDLDVALAVLRQGLVLI